MNNENEKLIGLVKTALSKVYENHIYLIRNRVNERSLVFWFGVYFYELLQDTEFIKYDLDFDYNKNYNEPKNTPNFKQGTYPDIILHKRGRNDCNLLVVEFKTHWNPNTEQDIIKLKDFTNQTGQYKYRLGMSIVLEELFSKLKLVINGKVQEEICD